MKENILVHGGIPDTQQGGNRTAGQSDQPVLQRNDPASLQR